MNTLIPNLVLAAMLAFTGAAYVGSRDEVRSLKEARTEKLKEHLALQERYESCMLVMRIINEREEEERIQ